MDQNKYLETLEAIYQDSVKNLLVLFNETRLYSENKNVISQNDSHDLHKRLFDKVREVGDIARTIQAVKSIQNKEVTIYAQNITVSPDKSESAS